MPGWMPESCGLYELFTQLTGDHGAGRQSDRAGQLRMRSSWLVVCGLRQKSPGCGLSGRGKGCGLRSWNRKSGSQRSQATNHPLKLAGDLGLDVTGGNSAPAFMRTCSTLRGRADHERCGAMRLVSSRHPAGTPRPPHRNERTSSALAIPMPALVGRYARPVIVRGQRCAFSPMCITVPASSARQDCERIDKGPGQYG
jgi:hypothetical protein